MVEFARQVSQLVTVQGWTMQAPGVVLTLKPTAQEVQVVAELQVRQLGITEQLWQVDVEWM